VQRFNYPPYESIGSPRFFSSTLRHQERDASAVVSRLSRAMRIARRIACGGICGAYFLMPWHAAASESQNRPSHLSQTNRVDLSPSSGCASPDWRAAIGNKAVAGCKTEEAETAAVLILEKLLGLEVDRVEKSLGRPTSINDNSPGKLWSYRRDGCTLTVAFYPESENGIFHALSYEVSSNEHDTSIYTSCGAKFAVAVPEK